MDLPKKLYKYQPLTAQSLVNLKSQVVYFGSPQGFNDPYDCNISPLLFVEDSDVERIREYYLSKNDITPDTHKELSTASDEKLKYIIINQSVGLIKEFSKEFITKRGISCFSTDFTNLLMWSHYASNATGFCLEFSTATELFSKAIPVRYTQTFPTINVAEIAFGGDDKLAGWIDQMFCTKPINWSYENEWRVIHKKSGTEYCYPPEALTGVYFGPKTPSVYLEMAALILRGQNETVKLHKGSLGYPVFRVEFEQIDYIPYLTAKKRGLR